MKETAVIQCTADRIEPPRSEGHTERMSPRTEKWRMGWAEHITRYRWSAEGIPPGLRVLDIGCGVGYGAKYLAQHGAKVVAVDYSAEALEQAQTGFADPAITYLQDNAQSLSKVTGQFDLIVAFEIFEHLAAPEEMVARSSELLVSGGHFICSTPNARFRPKLENGSIPRNPFHVREYTAAEFGESLSRHFSNIEMFGQDLTATYRRMREVLAHLEDVSQRRDFALWSNPIVRLGRLLQRLRRSRIDWPTGTGNLYPPQEQDVVIQSAGWENATTFLARCQKTP